MEKQTNIELRTFIGELEKDTVSPLNPRDSFYGGRTNCVKLYYEADETREEKLRYFDVCSLYPWACKYGKFPVGHPEVLVDDRCPQSLDGIEGIVKATVLPPETLYHPVLPVRLHGRLMFPLCKTCTEEMRQDDCPHTDEQRAFTGTWVSDELKKAVSKGYKLLKVHEVWKYKTTQFDGHSGGLFGQYIDKFLKLKQEASGWPSWCITDEDKERYIIQFEEREGIKLDPEKVKQNKGLRALAKLLLNCFWGKFGQRNNLQQTTFINTREQLAELVSNPGMEVDDILPLNEDVMVVNWKYLDDSVKVSNMTSVTIASYVTATARLKLYSYLEQLNERVLYFDTDSIIFVDWPGAISPPVGDFLGDLTDELAEYGPGSFIDSFVSGGPKNYAYRVRVGGSNVTRTVCKVKGISLNYENCKKVNFQKIKEMVLAPVPSSVLLTGKQICRTKNFDVITRPEKKTYRIVYTKRRITEEYDTLPYGFKKVRV